MNGGKTQYTVPGARVGTLDHGPTYAARFGAGIKERFKAYQERSAAAAADAPSADTSSDSLLGGKSRVQLRREKIKKALLIGVPTGAVITVAALMVAFRCEWFGADCPAPVDTSFRATGGGIKFTHNGETVGPLANVVLLGGDLAVNTTGIYQIFFSGPATAANATAIFGNSVIFLDADNPYAAFNITSPSRAEAQIFANGEQVSAMGPATLSTLVQFAQADQLTQVINGTVINMVAPPSPEPSASPSPEPSASSSPSPSVSPEASPSASPSPSPSPSVTPSPQPAPFDPMGLTGIIENEACYAGVGCPIARNAATPGAYDNVTYIAEGEITVGSNSTGTSLVSLLFANGSVIAAAAPGSAAPFSLAYQGPANFTADLNNWGLTAAQATGGVADVSVTVQGKQIPTDGRANLLSPLETAYVTYNQATPGCGTTSVVETQKSSPGGLPVQIMANTQVSSTSPNLPRDWSINFNPSLISFTQAPAGFMSQTPGTYSANGMTPAQVTASLQPTTANLVALSAGQHAIVNLVQAPIPGVCTGQSYTAADWTRAVVSGTSSVFRGKQAEVTGPELAIPAL